MGNSLESYFDFAENDYLFFRQAYDSNVRGSALAALGQNICERYLKHIISEYAIPDTNHEMREKEWILKSHSLNKLMKYIMDDMGIKIPDEAETNMGVIEGFYFTTRYPGADSFMPTSRDIEKANRAVESTRNFVLDVCHKLDHEQL